MASLFQKFQKAVGSLAKSPTFAKDPRHLQFEADINRLFLYTSYNRVGKDAGDADIEEIIDIASKASLADQQEQVQENIYSQIKTFCALMDDILHPSCKSTEEPLNSPTEKAAGPRRSGLSLAVGSNSSMKVSPGVPKTKPLKLSEVSQRIKDLNSYTLELKASQVPHKEAGQGLFINGEANVGAIIAFYPGVVYTPAYYRYIPGYPKVNAHNPYLITRYDGTIINAQPWGTGGETREVWDGLSVPEFRPNIQGADTGSDRVWKMLSKPLEATRLGSNAEVLERRNPLAFAHYANHPAKGMEPNVMVCSYDFPLVEKDMRMYIPNVVFGRGEEVKMKRFGSFWFKSGTSGSNVSDNPVLKTLVLVATRDLSNEEVLLNYRLSNAKKRPAWYTPVDEEEDRRRWS
ncbi:hypothetical protein DCAR_0208224 [Daucus carota subsp. sativus]|uniref:Uncharacterized protein n=1 Tax=Daucus carota subsp. sativus TaxID=79200 RepID=A0A166EEB4_DAUCS|nr:PREDICTED: uncharacterized protein LOC108206204 [Daucus carota subsp. sativus]WOG88989.1 hypothetical protein DCAR_0208224 [Daucus carota subsp. sativus]